MILGLLQKRSQQQDDRNNEDNDESLPFHHLNCCQISKIFLRYDEVSYNSLSLLRIVVVGRLIFFEKGISPRGMQIINVKLEDSTGTCKAMVYYRQHFWQLCLKGGYLKLSITAKNGGVVYRPELKLVCHSMIKIQNFDQLTQHYLECMKTQLQLQQQ